MRSMIAVCLSWILLLAVSCSGGGGASQSPMSPVKKQVGADWEELRLLLMEDGPAFAGGKAAAIAVKLQDPTITQDPRYADQGFRNLNDNVIGLLGKLERHVGERSFPDILISINEISNQCKRCHKLHGKS